MPQLPNRLQPDTPYPEIIALLNDNFDKTATDLADFGAKFSSGVARYSFTLAANSSFTQAIGVTDSRPEYKAGSVQVVPRMETFVDNDLNDAYLLGYVNSQNNSCLANLTTARRPATGNVATYIAQHFNRDTVSHTYYVYVDHSYINSPSTGVFR